MAIGTARMMGFQLPENFNLPYTSQSITEFWQRWHISLSSWLRDYLYIALGGNRKGQLRTYANLMITMLVGGLWHGASWNFVFWGGLNGSYMVLERVAHGGQHPTPGPWTRPAAWLRASAVFILVSVTWVFFRSPSLDTTLTVLRKLLLLDTGGFAWISPVALVTIVVFVVGGFLARLLDLRIPVLSLDKSYGPAVILGQIVAVYFLSPVQTSPFIYFQF
jgi:alginate O-acetyltransferase complex protein AlgI